MLTIHLRLHGRLRDALPPAQKGRTTLSLPPGATVADALAAVGLDDDVLIAINETHESHITHLLADGDEVSLFLPAAGG